MLYFITEELTEQGDEDMEKDENYMQELAERYRPDVERLIKYIPWLETKAGVNISRIYSGRESVSIPLLSRYMTVRC